MLTRHASAEDRLERHVRRLEGPRHPDTASARHARAERYVTEELEGTGWEVEAHGFRHGGRTHRNVAAVRGARLDGPRVLVGAHYDTVSGTPGADDNASGVAVLLEVARRLGELQPVVPVELVAFDLEEPRGGTYRIGSRRWVERAGDRGRTYAGALILEMVGYTDPREGAQEIPWLLRWRDIPGRGTFLAAVGDWRSRRLLGEFTEAASSGAPELELVTVNIPFRGWLVPQSRLSDNASFWDSGFPSLMLTDTAFLRNPHYHGPGDRAETLDYGFMAATTAAVTTAVRQLAGQSAD